MTYRDDNQALRARLEATEQRLHDAEDELAAANRRHEVDVVPPLPLPHPAVAPPNAVAPPTAVASPTAVAPPTNERSPSRALLGYGVMSLVVGVAVVLYELPAGASLGGVDGLALWTSLVFFFPGALAICGAVWPSARRKPTAAVALQRRR